MVVLAVAVALPGSRVRVRSVSRVWRVRRGRVPVVSVAPAVLVVTVAMVVPVVPVAARPMVGPRVLRVRWVWRPLVAPLVGVVGVVTGLTLDP
jgi:hypothetical protein